MADENDIEKEKRRLRKSTTPEQRIAQEKALQKARELEQKKIPTKGEELVEYENFMKESESAKKLLKPAWYLKKNNKNKKKQ